MTTLVEKVKLGLSNRDGEVLIGKDSDGICYLIVESDSFHDEPEFAGMWSTQHIVISDVAFELLKPTS